MGWGLDGMRWGADRTGMGMGWGRERDGNGDVDGIEKGLDGIGCVWDGMG